ncbi:hypothetical protein OROMI_029847 [Orobanche minor]
MDEDSGHLLTNPATLEIKILPKSSVLTPRLVVYQIMWFDHARQDYKLLQLVSTYAIDDQGDYTDPCYWIWCYSLQSYSWVQIDSTCKSNLTAINASEKVPSRDEPGGMFTETAKVATPMDEPTSEVYSRDVFKELEKSPVGLIIGIVRMLKLLLPRYSRDVFEELEKSAVGLVIGIV